MQSDGPKRHGEIGRTFARCARDLARCASSDDQSGVLAEVARSYNRDGTVYKGASSLQWQLSVTLSVRRRGEQVIDHNRVNMESIRVTEATARQDRVSGGSFTHDWGRGTAVFDDENLVCCADLVPVMALAKQTGLSDLLEQHVVFRSERIRSAAANPAPTSDCVSTTHLLMTWLR